MPALFELIEKPTLLLNEKIARQNIRRMVDRARANNVSFRPHFKTHQSIEIGEWFRSEGITAITVSSIDMAFYFSAAGWDDITIAFPVNLRQREKLAELARKVQLGILVESVETVNQLSRIFDTQVNVWIKVDTGLRRTGLIWEQTEPIEEVARAILASKNLRLSGLLTHGGQTYAVRGVEEVCRRYQESTARIVCLREELLNRGINPLQVSVGDTPGTSLCETLGPVEEIRPGNFIFYDSQQVLIGSCRWHDVAVALACPVVALHPDRGESVIYGGAIHLSKDYFIDGNQRGYGLVCLPDKSTPGWGPPLASARVTALSQEHGVIRLDEQDLNQIKVGELVCILPAHSCLTVTLMKRYMTMDGKIIETMNVDRDV